MGINDISYAQMDTFNVNNYKVQKSIQDILIISSIFELF